MTRKIFYSLAKTEVGHLVYAAHARKDKNYFCPKCDRPFILRQGEIKRPHFAHKNLISDCTPELALLYNFKTRLSRRIKDCISNNKKLPISLKCLQDQHYGSRSFNLVKIADAVSTDYKLGNLDDCIADIVLLKNDEPEVAIQVILNSPFDANYFLGFNVAVVGFVLKTDKDLARADSTPLTPDAVNLEAWKP